MSRAEQALAGPISDEEAARLKSHLVVAANGCWECDLKPAANGYCAFVLRRAGRGVRVLAHRLAYRVFRGLAPGGSFVMHTCDNRTCCRPEHLVLGSHQDNMDDMLRKGRQWRKFEAALLTDIAGSLESPTALAARHNISVDRVYQVRKGVSCKGLGPVLKRAVGRAHPRSGVLNESLVLQIRSSKEAASQLAARFGVSAALVRYVRRGDGWRHVGKAGVPATGGHHTVLTEAKVLEILRSPERAASLARALGCSTSLVRAVRKRRVWAHVPYPADQSQETHA